ncbi:MAG TPA: VOC family protein [Terriglobia bacterium]|nr:VOC family protein [Terriglobia bacterium]
MKLYIFRCKTQPKVYGATRYETASNLPTDTCSGAWEFYERVDLGARGMLRYGVDTGAIRRYVRQRGWHVWHESGGSLRKEPAETSRSRASDFDRPQPEPESLGFEDLSEFLPKSPPQPAATTKQSWRSFLEPEAVSPAPKQEEPIPAARAYEPPPPATPAPAASARHEIDDELPPRHHIELTDDVRRQEPEVKAPAPITRHEIDDELPPRRRIELPDDVQWPEPDIKAPQRPVVAPARHQVVWFDIPVRDIDRAVRFYSAVLGITLKKEQAGPGAAVAALPHGEGSVGGSLVQNMDAKPSESGPLLYLNADGRLEEALKAVEKYGGRIVAEIHSIAPFGFRAVVVDSEGNRIALHSV